MSEFASVLDLARELTREANLISEGEEVRLKAEQVLARVAEVTADLAKLRQVVTAARRLATESGEASVSLTGLDDGLKAFSGYVSRDGLPSNPAFTSARGKISNVTKRVSAELETAWSTWAAAEKNKVPKIRIALLAPAEKKAANDRWAEITRIANVQSPSVTDIVALKSALGILNDMLEDIRDPTGRVADVLQLLDRPRGVTLADLTDTDITALRDAGIADQIEVHRRNR